MTIHFDEPAFLATLDAHVTRALKAGLAAPVNSYENLCATTHPDTWRGIVCNGVNIAATLLQAEAHRLYQEAGLYGPHTNLATSNIASAFRAEMFESHLYALDIRMEGYRRAFETIHWHIKHGLQHAHRQASEFANDVVGSAAHAAFGDAGWWLAQFTVGALAGEQMMRDRHLAIDAYMQQRAIAIDALGAFNNATELRASQFASHLAHSLEAS